MKRNFMSLFFAVSSIAGITAQAAQRHELSGTAEQLAEANRSLMSAVNSPSNAPALVSALGLGEGASLKLLKQDTDRGITFQRYQQLYQGIPVWGEHVVVGKSENDSNKIERLSGTVFQELSADFASNGELKPAFDAKTALQVAHSILEKSLNSKTKALVAKSPLVFSDEKSELTIFINSENKAVLAYVVNFFADRSVGGTPMRPTYIIDANTKEILLNFEGLTTGTAGTARGPGGNLKTGKYMYGAEFPAMPVDITGNTCTMKTANVSAINLNGSTSGSTPYSFTCPENTYKEINGGYSPINDAFFYGTVVVAMYKNWFNVSPLKFPLTMSVHYSTGYENAFWNGKGMTFGDGASRFYPLVSLDVSAHEVSHGFTEQNSGLTYSGQSGGLNESFSDVAGEAAEFFMRGKNDFLVGAEIVKAVGKGLRYFEDPTKDGKSIGNAANYNASLDVHYSSGVFNRLFFLVATTRGWGVKKAFEVWVKANQHYWTPSATYITAGKGLLSAAKDLGYSQPDIIAALTKVGVVVQ